MLQTLQFDPPGLSTFPDEKKGQTKCPGTEWASKSSQLSTFYKKCLKKNPDDRATIKQLLKLKFPATNRQEFAQEIAKSIPLRLHEQSSQKKKNPKPAAGEDAAGHSAQPSWDFQDVPKEKEKASQEVNDDNFNEMWAKEIGSSDV